MGVTISTHNGSKVARQHNIRDKRVVSKEAHINPNGVHETWIDETPRKAYDRIFGEALKEYNAHQTRPERQITSYYDSICNDAKKHPVYEMIIGIYGKDKNGKPICSEAVGKQIMLQFVDEWSTMNPNLELIGAYYHADEQGEPHVHLDYIPVAEGYTRGLKTQNGLVKALEQQGFEKDGKRTAQIQWEARENKRLEQICNKHGLTVDHPRNGLEHVEKELYIKKQELSAVQGQIRDAKEFQDYKEEQDFFGHKKGFVKMQVKDYIDMKKTIDEIEEVRTYRVRSYLKQQDAEKKLKEAKKLLAQAETKERQADQAYEEWKEYSDNEKQYILKQAKQVGDGRLSRLEEFCQELKFKDGQSILDRFEEKELELTMHQSRGLHLR